MALSLLGLGLRLQSICGFNRRSTEFAIRRTNPIFGTRLSSLPPQFEAVTSKVRPTRFPIQRRRNLSGRAGRSWDPFIGIWGILKRVWLISLSRRPPLRPSPGGSAASSRQPGCTLLVVTLPRTAAPPSVGSAGRNFSSASAPPSLPGAERGKDSLPETKEKSTGQRNPSAPKTSKPPSGSTGSTTPAAPMRSSARTVRSTENSGTDHPSPGTSTGKPSSGSWR
jgi:hypothetical protein